MRRVRTASVALAVTAVVAMMSTAPASAGGGAEGVPALTHVFLVIGENTQLSQINAGNAPYLVDTLMPASASLTNYWATTHYSEANYVAMMAGQFSQCQQKDGTAASCHWDVENLFRQLHASGKTFTTWSESMPAPCYLLNSGGDATGNHYAAKHNPQLFFDNVEGDSVTAVGSGVWVDNGSTQGGAFCRQTNISTSANGNAPPNDMSVFENSLAGNAGAPAVSDFNVVVPNECEDAHDNCKPAGNAITQYDAFLQREVPLIQNYINSHGGLLLVTFDEGVTSSPKRSVKFGNGGNVAFVAWGPQVHPAVYPDGPYTHYSLLRTLEDGFGVGGYAGKASLVTPIAQIWK